MELGCELQALPIAGNLMEQRSHLWLFPLPGIPQGRGDLQAGEAAGEAGVSEHHPLPGSMQGLSVPPGVQEVEGTAWGSPGGSELTGLGQA